MFILWDIGQEKQVSAMSWSLITFLIFRVRVLAEANRSPFDFAEGERGLVRGFNTEYRSVLFVIVFLAEYMAIIFMSSLSGILFISTTFLELVTITLIVGFFYI